MLKLPINWLEQVQTFFQMIAQHDEIHKFTPPYFPTVQWHLHNRVYRPTIISEINMILGGCGMQTHLD